MRTCFAAVMLTLVLASACSRSPAEPEPKADRAELPATKKLLWTVPATWTTDQTAERGLYRARYKIPKAGDAKHPAELLVTHIGKTTKAELDAKHAGLVAEFEKPTEHPRRTSFAVGDIAVRMVEIAGTYKFPVGPQVGAGNQKKHAAHMLKPGWRGIGASAKTAANDTWFFKLVGPDDSVQAARSAFENMLRSVRY